MTSIAFCEVSFLENEIKFTLGLRFKSFWTALVTLGMPNDEKYAGHSNVHSSASADGPVGDRHGDDSSLRRDGELRFG